MVTKTLSVFAFVLAMALLASPVLADDDVTVRNRNSAYVKNDVNVSASSGSNDGNGGNAIGGAGNGGGVSNSGTGNEGGNGGDDMSAGGHGIITTGNAGAAAVVSNNVNTNRTRINMCGCEEENGGDVVLRNRNWATVKNYVDVSAESGYNDANGGDAIGGAGNAGSVSNSNNNNSGGDGGEGNSVGGNGDVLTGDANAAAAVINVVNRNVTRIRR